LPAVNILHAHRALPLQQDPADLRPRDDAQPWIRSDLGEVSVDPATSTPAARRDLE